MTMTSSARRSPHCAASGGCRHFARRRVRPWPPGAVLRSLPRLCAAAAAAAALAASAAAEPVAGDAAPVHLGSTGSMEIWRIGTAPDILLIARDGKTVFRGRMFHADAAVPSRDRGASLGGYRAPVSTGPDQASDPARDRLPSPSPAPSIPAAMQAPVSDASTPDAERLLEDVRRNALWFSVGANDAPAVYAFIDPTCPHSARAVAVLSDEIDAGRLQLRVALAPVVSDGAGDAIAAIFAADDPAAAFVAHEIRVHETGRTGLKPAAFDEMPEALRRGVRRNFDLIMEHGIAGVPFFVHATAAGARIVPGAPDGLAFPGAVSDGYAGQTDSGRR